METLTAPAHDPVFLRVLDSGPSGPTRNVAAMLLGGRLLNLMLGKRQLSLSDMPLDILLRLLATHGVRSLASLYEDVGTGKLPASTVVRSLLDLLAGTAATFHSR